MDNNSVFFLIIYYLMIVGDNIMRIIFASGSKQRRDIFDYMGLNYIVMKSDIV